MPFVRISLRHGTSLEYRKALADGVHRAMVEAIAIPPTTASRSSRSILQKLSFTIHNTSVFVAPIASSWFRSR